MNSPPSGGAPAARLASLGSGSRGNGTLVSIAGKTFLIDCGFTLKESWARLVRLGVDPASLAAVLVTHEHSDHSAGVAPLAHRFNLPVHLSHGTLRSVRKLDAGRARPFDSDVPFHVGDVGVHPVAVPHDAREPTQFVFEWQGVRIGVLTDVGYVTPHVVASFAGCHALLVESNHDRGMLVRGDYPERLKRRIAGNLGHLSNEQAAEFLESVAHDGLQHVVVGHVSEQNNSRERLDAVFEPFRRRLPSLEFATQREGAGWFDLTPAAAPRAQAGDASGQ